MLPGMPGIPVPNITGGHASSGTGDDVFTPDGNSFGGINYKTGVSPFLIVFAALAAILVLKNV